MLDLRVYRAAFVPALLALFLVAFALTGRPAPATSDLAAEAFDGTRAFGSASATPPRDSLLELARAFPERRPGSQGDAGLADRVERAFRVAGLRVERRAETGDTVDGRVELGTVVGVRPGLSDRRIVVLAHRDALGAPGLAELSGTAALLELARVFRARDRGAGAVRGGERPRVLGRDLAKTLVLVSTSGGTGGVAGARAWAREAAGEPVDAVLVLGDLASQDVRKPWVVPWSTGRRTTPIGLRRTVESAVRTEVGADPGGARATGQWARRAVPFTVSPQGEVVAAGLPAVLLSVSGERGPEADAAVSAERLDEFGRAALRAISAVDTQGAPGDGEDAAAASADGEEAAAFGEEADGIVALRNVVPDWSIRLLVAALLAPALLAALDALFRARRRRVPVARWAGWLAALALPLALAWAWMRLLDLLGVVHAPPTPVLPGAVRLDTGAAVALASTALVLAAGVLLARRLAARASALPVPEPVSERRFARRGARAGVGRSAVAAEGLAAATCVVLCVLVAAVWIANPYTAALLLPAAHGWLLAAAGRARGAAGALALAAGLALPALVVLHGALALDLGPLGLLWTAFLAVAGGHASLGVVVTLAGVAACLAGVLGARRLARRAVGERPGGPRGPERAPIVTRGPLSYAGPGSLGGTESALRR